MSEVASIAGDIAGAIPAVTEAATDVAKIGDIDGANKGTGLEARVSGAEDLLQEILTTLAHLFPTHFKL